jgi:hypothetical protein
MLFPLQRVAAAASASHVLPHAAGSLAALAPFLPAFHGVAHPRGAAGGAHLRLADATASLALPCVADVKIGFSTGDARLGDTYAAKCARKDAATTSRATGFRLAGMQHWQRSGKAETLQQHDDAAAWACVRAERAWCKALDAPGALSALARFCACGLDVGSAAGRATARAVLHGPRGALAQLRGLMAWFEAQQECLFFGASVLLLYDAAPLRSVTHTQEESRGMPSALDADALRVTLKARTQQHGSTACMRMHCPCV